MFQNCILSFQAGNIVCQYQASLRTEFDKMAEKVKSKSVQILDSRAADIYAAGHVPGAVNIPFADKLLNADKTAMKSVDELKKGKKQNIHSI